MNFLRRRVDETAQLHDVLVRVAVPQRGEGSGFIIDPAGYIATNYHVVDSASQVTVTLAGVVEV